MGGTSFAVLKSHHEVFDGILHVADFFIREFGDGDFSIFRLPDVHGYLGVFVEIKDLLVIYLEKRYKHSVTTLLLKCTHGHLEGP
jgi:hypothetical protein